jgi:hypothetical protein
MQPPARRVGERDHRRRVEIAVGCKHVGADIELGDEQAFFDGHHAEPEESRQAAAAARIHFLDRNAGTKRHMWPSVFDG